MGLGLGPWRLVPWRASTHEQAACPMTCEKSLEGRMDPFPSHRGMGTNQRGVPSPIPTLWVETRIPRNCHSPLLPFFLPSSLCQKQDHLQSDAVSARGQWLGVGSRPDPETMSGEMTHGEKDDGFCAVGAAAGKALATSGYTCETLVASAHWRPAQGQGSLVGKNLVSNITGDIEWGAHPHTQRARTGGGPPPTKTTQNLLPLPPHSHTHPTPTPAHTDNTPPSLHFGSTRAGDPSERVSTLADVP